MATNGTNGQSTANNSAQNGNGHSHANGTSVSRVDHFTTRSIHVGSEPDAVTGAVVPVLSVATTFKQDGIGKHRGHEYSRSSNPTRSALEEVLTSLETCPVSATSETGCNDCSGGETLVFASGSAATAAMVNWIALQTEEGGAGGADGESGIGGHVLAINDVYGGTARYLSRTARSMGIEVTYLDFQKAGEKGIRAAIRPDTRVIWLECPTNPLLLVPPLPLIASIVDSLPDESRPIMVVDTTFLSSFYFSPLIPVDDNCTRLADVVLSSMSKYAGGHSDLILGSLTLSPRLNTIRPEISKGLRFLQNSMGGIPSPRDCHLAIRSLKTLGVRMLRHGLNALRVAAWLSERDDVERVRYPGLRTDGAFHMVEHLLAPNARLELQFLGWKFPYQTKPAERKPSTIDLDYVRTLGIPFGGMVTFKLKDASAEEAERFATKLRLIILAESLGGVESLIEVPAGMTHAGLPAETREALGITDNLLRLSVGIEDADDLISDLEHAFSVYKS